MAIQLNFRLKKMVLNWVFVFLFTTFMVGCVNMQDDVPNTSWPQHQASLSALQTYRASGKIAYRSPQARQSLNFNLKQSPNLTQLKLMNFLGQTLLTAEVSPQNTTITDLNGDTHHAQDASQLIFQLTGISVPVTQLTDWIKGLPTGSDEYQLNSSQRISQFSQTIDRKNWDIIYRSYQIVESSSQPELGLPQNIVLRQAQDELKITITNWSY